MPDATAVSGSHSTATRFAIIGPGRAGRSFRSALTAVGAVCVDVIGSRDSPERLDPHLDLVLITVPDRVIAEVAASTPRGPLVAHVSGATTLEPLLPHHDRCGSLHPLLSLPDSVAGTAALLAGANLAVAGADAACVQQLLDLADLLGARPFVVDDTKRTSYHAAASIAANHLVALSAQVERVADEAGVPFAPFVDMMRAVLDNVERSGAAASLTGPVARADWATVEAHVDAVSADEQPLYLALAKACSDLAGHPFPIAPRPHTAVPEEQS